MDQTPEGGTRGQQYPLADLITYVAARTGLVGACCVAADLHHFMPEILATAFLVSLTSGHFALRRKSESDTPQ